MLELSRDCGEEDMSVITFNCPGCQQPIEAPAEMAGQQAECPSCEQIIDIPGEDESLVELSYEEDSAADVSDGNVCVSCNAVMDPDAVLCLQCGYHSVLGKKIETEL